MKSILNKVYFHPLFLLTILIFILIGEFRFISYFMILILIHELGHILVSQYFNWNIEKIKILPFGGLIQFNEIINRPIFEEFLISISGLLFQMLFFVLIKNKINYNYFEFINYFILIFNLIPIYPLDGAKILNVFLNKITTFKKSIIISIIVSYISIISLLILFFNINKLIIVVLIFLFIEVNKFYKERKYIFNKFLLERYLGKLEFKNTKIVKKIDEMKKDYTHLFYVDKKYISESKILAKIFDIKGNL